LNGALKKLPQEIADRIYEDFPLSTEQAMQVRYELMEQRKDQQKDEEHVWDTNRYYPFSEH
jgi:hypothetical protein